MAWNGLTFDFNQSENEMSKIGQNYALYHAVLRKKYEKWR